MRALALLAALAAQAAAPLQVWRLGPEGRVAGPGDGALPAGSLQKPFVAKAWAAAHPGQAPPRLRCGPGDRCWARAGHGELGLARALALSCNAYFRRLAQDTPPEALAAELEAEGFGRDPEMTPDLAIGLQPAGRALPVRPSALLGAYARLVREPWPAGEAVRQELLLGLREAARLGTAGSLGRRGWWAKTGTVPAPDGNPLRTWGLALAVDDAGRAVLVRLMPGTGHQAAGALGPLLDRSDATPAREGPVTVRLLGLLHPRRVRVRNLGPAPVPAGRGWLGPGAEAPLAPGEPVGPGLLELREPKTGLRRRLRGTVSVGRDGALRAELAPRDYVEGVVDAELPAGRGPRVELAAAVLRFLVRGARHGDADVCDSTHCAWFVGRGPRLSWADPQRARAAAGGDGPWGLSDAEWSQARETAQRPGPDQWSAHCGGRPLSPHALWGGPDAAAPPCPRHGAPSRPWTRAWPAGALAKAFGAPVRILEVGEEGGTWVLKVDGRSLRYDEAHRRLAAALGWDALPSPAEAVEPWQGGFRARGFGSGHRVGLCLGE